MKNYFQNIKLYFEYNMKFNPILVWVNLTLAIGLAVIPYFISDTQATIIDQIVAYLKDGVSNNVDLVFGIPALILTPVLLYGIIMLVKNGVQSLRSLTWHVARTKFQMKFEQVIFNKFLSLDTGRYEDPDFKLVVEKGIDAGNQWSLDRLGGFFTRDIIPDLISFVVAAYFVARFDIRILFILIAIQLPYLFIIYFFDKRSFNIWDYNGGKDQRMYYSLRNLIRGKDV